MVSTESAAPEVIDIPPDSRASSGSLPPPPRMLVRKGTRNSSSSSLDLAVAAAHPSGLAVQDYSPTYYSVRMLNMELRMTELLEVCARGFADDCESALEQIQSHGGEHALESELSAVDDWAGSSPLHWSAYANSAECIRLYSRPGGTERAAGMLFEFHRGVASAESRLGLSWASSRPPRKSGLGMSTS